MMIQRVWHFSGAPYIPEQFRSTPFELAHEDLARLTDRYAVLLYRNDENEMVLAFDDPRGRFKQR
jgi:hypothetical protein